MKVKHSAAAVDLQVADSPQENETSHVELHGKDPRVVDAMVDWLYLGGYAAEEFERHSTGKMSQDVVDGLTGDWTSSEEPATASPQRTNKGNGRMAFYAKIYAIGNRVCHRGPEVQGGQRSLQLLLPAK